MENAIITEQEKAYLRELAKKYIEYSALPVMQKRKEIWYDHNSLKAEYPMLVMEMDTFYDDIVDDLKCTSAYARQIERHLKKWIVNHKLINDDKVIPPYFPAPMIFDHMEFGVKISAKHAADSQGRNIGYSLEHPIKDIVRDIDKIKHSGYRYNKEKTILQKDIIENTIGDILDVQIKNMSIVWYLSITTKAVMLMGLENLLISMMDHPDETKNLLEFIKTDMVTYMTWLEDEGLLTLNNGYEYAGAGSYGFTNELPKNTDRNDGRIRLDDLWINMNAQESVGVSPEMYEEFIYPHYHEIARLSGLVYYGCCEPVHTLWDRCLKDLPNLRKISISPWCDEEYMGDVLKEGNIIYSRKPSPNFFSQETFDEEAFRSHIEKTVKAARGGQLEIIFRDIYTLRKDKKRPGRAVDIAREVIDKYWI